MASDGLDCIASPDAAWCMDVADILKDHGSTLPFEPEDEAVVCVDKNLLRSLHDEVTARIAAVSKCGYETRNDDDRLPCPLCPFRSFAGSKKAARRACLHHLRKHHLPRDASRPQLESYVPGGTKHVKLVKALWDKDAMAGGTGECVLQRAAAFMREHYRGPGLHTSNVFVKDVVFVLTGRGPVFWAKTAVKDRPEVRRCGYTYYTKDFAEQFAREALLAHGRVRPVRARLLFHYAATGNPAAFMLPVNVRTWLELLEDVMSCKCVQDLSDALAAECVEHEEFRYISMDATLRVAMRIKGQAGYRDSAAKRNAALVKDDTALRRVLTVRGRTGAVLVSNLIRSEAGQDIAALLKDTVHSAALQQIEVLATDQPSKALLLELQKVCPRLRCLYLDSVHIVIVYHTSFWHKTSAGQVILRRMQARFQRVDPDAAGGAWDWGVPFVGDASPRLTSSEEGNRAMILDGSMSKARAVAVLNAIDDTKPWYRRADYIEAMAALSAVHHGEMTRKTYMQSRTLARVLYAYTAPDKLEWLWNGLRMRHSMPAAMVALLGSGTSPNESLHAEINRWFRNQPEVFPSTLALQLQVCRLGKVMAHNRAMYHPSLRQLGHDSVLAGAVAGLSFDASAWATWSSSGLSSAASLPLHAARRTLQARLHTFGRPKRQRMETVYSLSAKPTRRLSRKTPAADTGGDGVRIVKRPASAAARVIKRTPFNLRRKHV